MKKSIFLSIILLPCITISLHAQEILVDYNPVNKLKLYYDEYYMQFEFAIEEKLEIEIDDNLFYYWYKENKINRTQGGLDGKALHGNFTVFFNSGKLKEKGQFNIGLKDGKWKKWYDNGNLYEVGNWENGLKTGKWVQYEKEGRLAVVANYKDGILDGDYSEYNEGELWLKKKFNNGKETRVKEKKQKKKDKEEKEQPQEDDETTEENQ